MIQENHQKRIVSNEDLMDSVLRLEGAIFRMEESLTDLRKSILEGFVRVFEVIDEAKNELRLEFKNDIHSLRKEMNQRFTIVDNRLSLIEDNMVYKHQLSPKFV